MSRSGRHTSFCASRLHLPTRNGLNAFLRAAVFTASRLSPIAVLVSVAHAAQTAPAAAAAAAAEGGALVSAPVAILIAVLLLSMAGMAFILKQRKVVQSELARTLDEFQSIFNTSLMGILVLDGDRRIARANTHFARLAGYNDPGQLEGVSIKKFHLSDEDFEYFSQTHLPALAAGRPVRTEYHFKDRRGKTVWISLSGRALDQGPAPDLAKGMVWVLEDVTERNQTSRELEALNRTLEEKVRERTRLLEEKAERLKDANNRLLELDQMKSAFLTTVSHDLRTPLTSIRGFAKLIHRDFDRHFRALAKNDSKLVKKGGRIEDNLDIIEKEGERLTRLINDFLDLSKIETGSMTFQDRFISIRDIIEEAVDTVHGQFAQKPEVRLLIHVPEDLPPIAADPDRILQVLVNLLGNAAKFTDRGKVEVSAQTLPENRIRVEVADTGVGIPRRDAHRVFDKFHQVSQSDTLRHGPKGSGLGLAISKEIITHYNGVIRVDSSPGKGSAFYFILPGGSKTLDANIELRR